jgi:hypothetical protein
MCHSFAADVYQWHLIATLRALSSLTVPQRNAMIFRTQLQLTNSNAGGKLHAFVQLQLISDHYSNAFRASETN